MTTVRIDNSAWSDIRFATLARLCELADADHALSKVARIWLWQTENFSYEAPTYHVDVDTIESVLGRGGAAAMVRARLAVEEPEGYRIKGTKGRIEWLCNKRLASAAGGEATRRKWDNERGPQGRPPARPEEGQDEAEAGDRHSPPTPALAPADPKTESQPPRAPARDPSTPGLVVVRPPVDDVERARSERIGEILQHIGPLHAAAYMRVRRELSSTARPMSVVGHFTDLRDLLHGLSSLEDAQGNCEHAIAVREAEAVAKRSLQYFGESMWRRASYEKALRLTVVEASQQRQQARGGPGEKRGPTEIALDELDRLERAERGQ